MTKVGMTQLVSDQPARPLDPEPVVERAVEQADDGLKIQDHIIATGTPEMIAGR